MKEANLDAIMDRIAALVAKLCDGHASDETVAEVEAIQAMLENALAGKSATFGLDTA